MRVLKFGGTSLGNAERLKAVAEIVKEQGDCIVVCSAMAGVTNKLEQVNDLWLQGLSGEARSQLQFIENDFTGNCYQLFEEKEIAVEIISDIRQFFHPLYDLLSIPCSPVYFGKVLALGELVTSYIFNAYMRNSGTPSFLLNALDFMCLNDQDEPSPDDIAGKLGALETFSQQGVYVTQGFICMDAAGNISNLKRGGSDYTATLVGASLNASEIQIWTDIDGLHNNDPRFIENTSPIRELSFAEAAELAYFGAKILHPACVWPAREENIPILLKNTLQPLAAGTKIQTASVAGGVKALAAKDGITIIRITSGRMFNAYGFLKKLFEVFDQFSLPVDVVTTSEVSVSVTIEDDSRIDELVAELMKLGRVSVESNCSIICAVGQVTQFAGAILEAVKPMDVKMVSLGASSDNITFVLPAHFKVNALSVLHNFVVNSQTLTQLPCNSIRA